MSRSRVKRGLAWTTTATPPITTKSTPAPTSAPISAVGRKSGQLATVQLASGCEPASLLVHRFQAPESFCWPQFELLAYQAFIDGGPSRACCEHQLSTGCSHGAIQRGEAGVRVGSLELSHGCLADREPLCEIGLGQSRAPPSIREHLAGERRRTSGWGRVRRGYIHAAIIAKNLYQLDFAQRCERPLRSRRLHCGARAAMHVRSARATSAVSGA